MYVYLIIVKKKSSILCPEPSIARMIAETMRFRFSRPKEGKKKMDGKFPFRFPDGLYRAKGKTLPLFEICLIAIVRERQ